MGQEWHVFWGDEAVEENENSLREKKNWKIKLSPDKQSGGNCLYIYTEILLKEDSHISVLI